MKIVYVCTGNQCRSPVAEYVARSFANELAAQAKTKGPRPADLPSLALEFASAGTHAHRDTPMDPRSLRFLAEEGINAEGFSSTRLNRAVLAGADIVVGMETAHVEHTLRIAPALLKKAATLRQLAAWSTIDSVHFPRRHRAPSRYPCRQRDTRRPRPGHPRPCGRERRRLHAHQP